MEGVGVIVLVGVIDGVGVIVGVIDGVGVGDGIGKHKIYLDLSNPLTDGTGEYP